MPSGACKSAGQKKTHLPVRRQKTKVEGDKRKKEKEKERKEGREEIRKEEKKKGKKEKNSLEETTSLENPVHLETCSRKVFLAISQDVI
jgi:hypothetical protein